VVTGSGLLMEFFVEWVAWRGFRRMFRREHR
jgi:hypothetical protein